MAQQQLTQEGAITGDVRKILNDNFNEIYGQTVKSTTEFDVDSGTTGTTLTNVVGLVVNVTPGTYKYKIHLAGTSTSNSGMKVGLKFGTASMLTSIENTARAFTASAVAVSHSTTATDAASLLASTTAIINAELEGTVVVAASGTLQLQAAQNASHADNTTIYVGSFMTFTKFA